MAETVADEDLKQTPLHDLHVELGARMVPFAGYSMPVQYKAGIMAEEEYSVRCVEKVRHRSARKSSPKAKGAVTPETSANGVDEDSQDL